MKTIHFEVAGDDAATKSTRHWWRCPNGAFEFVDRSKGTQGTNGGFTRPKPQEQLFLDWAWKCGQEYAAWSYELARRATGGSGLPTFPNTTMDERFFLRTVFRRSQEVWVYQQTFPPSTSPGRSTLVSWRLDLPMNTLVSTFKVWIEEQQKAAGITPHRPANKTSKGPSWIWPELIDGPEAGLNDSEMRTLSKAKAAAQSALDTMRRELREVRFAIPWLKTAEEHAAVRARAFPNLESLLTK